MFDPFRVLYPEKNEYSYTSFRRNDNFGKNRLDFFLVSSSVMGEVKNVIYEDRIGRDFDHKGVTLILGRAEGIRKEKIHNETLSRNEIKYIGVLAFLDIINEHKTVPDANIRRTLGQLELRIRELELLKLSHGVIGNEDGGEEGGEIIEKELVIQEIIDTLPGVEEMLRGEFSCNRKSLYEVLHFVFFERLRKTPCKT